MILYFNTINSNKIKEIEYIFAKHPSYETRFLNQNIIEILTPNIEEVVKNKAVAAYEHWRLPVIVEHGSLEIEYFNNFPGALSKPMWDLMNDKICSLIPDGSIRNATVISAVCLCNGKELMVFKGHTSGRISIKGLGNQGFQFDPIFIPNGSIKTYGEMSIDEKMPFSQATKSYSKLIEFLDNQ